MLSLDKTEQFHNKRTFFTQSDKKWKQNVISLELKLSKDNIIVIVVSAELIAEFRTQNLGQWISQFHRNISSKLSEAKMKTIQLDLWLFPIMVGFWEGTLIQKLNFHMLFQNLKSLITKVCKSNSINSKLLTQNENSFSKISFWTP